jgi:hypothetical protein
MQNYKASNGKYYTRQLFWDEAINLAHDERVVEPMFSLHKDKPNLINLRREYVRLGDPTGYRLAEEVLGDYVFWQTLMKCKWFVAAKKLWDEELDLKLSSQGMTKIKELLNDGLPAQQLAAAKYLAGKEYRKDKTASKGRPTKDQVEEAAREEASLDRQIADDYQRLTLVKK